MLTALLGMMVLASARELVLLFVAFELMSIPLYILAGFIKKDARVVEASLKFFLVGSLSTAFLAYGLSFVFGVTGSTRLDAVARAMARGTRFCSSGSSWSWAGSGSRSPRSRSTCGSPTPTRPAPAPFVAWLSVAPKAAGFAVVLRVFIEHVGPPAALWAARLRSWARSRSWPGT
jgi:NADH-quinone oxidoreductase subunit N